MHKDFDFRTRLIGRPPPSSGSFVLSVGEGDISDGGSGDELWGGEVGGEL